MKKFRELVKTALFMLFVVAGFYACQESDRLTIGSDDGLPPGPPTLVDTMLFNGGARIYYNIPSDKDLLSIDAEYTAANGEVRRFSVSYYTDSLDVLGMTEQTVVRLYAMDRAGNKSTVVPIIIKPLESAVSQVFDSLDVKAGFDALVVSWKNLQQQPVNVFAKINYTQQGVAREVTSVFTSRNSVERQFINNLTGVNTVDVTVYVEDRFGNVSASRNKQLALFQDVVIPKDNWTLPDPNDTIGGIPMAFGDLLEGKNRFVIDGKIDFGNSVNYMHTGHWQGRTGNRDDGNQWNFIIDLGDTYELSRIVTHQGHHVTNNNDPNLQRGEYYQGYNVAIYDMYVWVGAGDPRLQPWNEAGWEFVSRHRIDTPTGVTTAQLVKLGHAGDEAILYPDNPRFTPPTRWFRYEALNSFSGNYTEPYGSWLSEITLYGKKK
ncbi:hypothetical protein AGMMS49982_14710 [Bacteroidia bacterium]|nr:hypothetical protein AGMMS49982_14710 [Bacteroidia bacterium]